MKAEAGFFHRRKRPETAGESLLRIVGVRLELQGRPILQEPARFEGLSVRDYLRVAAARMQVEDCLRRVGLDPEEYADRAVDLIVRGMLA